MLNIDRKTCIRIITYVHEIFTNVCLFLIAHHNNREVALGCILSKDRCKERLCGLTVKNLFIKYDVSMCCAKCHQQRAQRQRSFILSSCNNNSTLFMGRSYLLNFESSVASYCLLTSMYPSN